MHSFSASICLLMIAFNAWAVVPRIGIAPCGGTMLTAQQKQMVTLQIQTHLSRMRTVEVVESAQTGHVAQEHALAQSGIMGTGDVAGLGRELGADQLLIPTFTRLGGIVTLNLRLVDVATGKTLGTAATDSRRSFKDLLKTDLPLTVTRIFGREDPSRAVYRFDPRLERKPVAILDIQGYGISSTDSRGLTDRLRNELFNTGVYEVMERDRMDALLKEQGLQQSGVCQEDRCIASAGQMIGVQYMVGGSVSRIGSLYSVSSRLIDVQSGKIVRSASLDVRGNLERVLGESMNDMARSVSGKKLLVRTNYPAIGWLAGGAACLAASGFLVWNGFDQYRWYQDEQADLGALREYKQNSQQSLYLAYGCAALASACVALSIKVTIDRGVRLRIDQAAP